MDVTLLSLDRPALESFLDALSIWRGEQILTKYKFRLAGVSPEQAQKEIEIPPDLSVKEVKEIVRKAYNLPPDFDIQLILPDKSSKSSTKNSK